LQQQLRAIKALNQDPFEQDLSDISSSDPPSSDTLDIRSTIKAFTVKNASITPRTDTKQTILHGTAMRDKLLRAFQEDFIPYDSSSSASNADVHAVIPPASQLRPTDIDAVAAPSVSTHRGPSGIVDRNQLVQSWTRRFRGDSLPMEGDPDLELNLSQMKAIAMMLSERLSLVQGVSVASNAT